MGYGYCIDEILTKEERKYKEGSWKAMIDSMRVFLDNMETAIAENGAHGDGCLCEDCAGERDFEFDEKCGSFGFEKAILLVKKGYKVKRRGWNGQDQYIDLAKHVSFEDSDGLRHGTGYDDGACDCANIKAIAFHGTSGIQLGWLASQADMLSNDWVIVG